MSTKRSIALGCLNPRISRLDDVGRDYQAMALCRQSPLSQPHRTCWLKARGEAWLDQGGAAITSASPGTVVDQSIRRPRLVR